MANVCRVFIIIRRLETVAGVSTVTVTAVQLEQSESFRLFVSLSSSKSLKFKSKSSSKKLSGTSNSSLGIRTLELRAKPQSIISIDI